MPTRLFVPLATEPFAWFASGEKKWELRRLGKRFNSQQVKVGREVELRRGYNTKDKVWGKIAEVIIASSIDEFFKVVPFAQVIPTALEKKDALQKAEEIIGQVEDGVIGFRISSSK